MKFDRLSGTSKPAARRPSFAPRFGSSAGNSTWTALVETLAAAGAVLKVDRVLNVPASQIAAPVATAWGQVSSSVAGD